MSYVKELMAIAATWMKVNPSYEGKLTLPRYRTEATEDRSYVAQWEQTRDRARLHDPARADQLTAAIHEVIKLNVHVDETVAALREAERQIEYQINEVEGTMQNKLTVDMKNPVYSTVHGRWCLAWGHTGYNVFELTNDFVAAMLLTDPRQIRFEDLRAPFPGILITIPVGFVIGSEGLPYTKIHLSFVDGSWNLIAFDGVHVLDTSVAEGKVLSWDLFESLEERQIYEQADVVAIRSIRQIVFGMLAYITAVDRAVEERPTSISKKKRGIDSGPRPRVHDVGRTITIDPMLVRCARNGARDIALQLKHRFIVRGHYREQAHGHARRDRKTIWIMPFWKGPEEGAKLVHTYTPASPDVPAVDTADDHASSASATIPEPPS